MSSFAIGLIVFACVFGGVLIGFLLRSRLPDHHVGADSKDAVKLSMGVIGTMSALVLGLLTATAKSSFDAQRGGVSQLAGNAILLDRTLKLYGPETKDIRALLRESLNDMIRSTWPDEHGGGDASATEGRYEQLYERILALEPKTEAQRALQAQALKIVSDTGQMRWQLFAQRQDNGVPTVLLVVLIAWLAIVHGSFGLFAPANATAILSLLVAALVVSSAVFLILELERPFSGMIRISSEPLRRALEHLGH